MTISSKTTSSMTLQPSMAWLTVFVPALSYYVATRMNMSTFLSHSSLGILTTNSIQASECSPLQDIFYLRDSCSSSSSSPSSSPKERTFSFQHPLYLILGPEEEEEEDKKTHTPPSGSGGFHDIVDTIWKHDSELGRGYLLLSQSYQNGRIWRFEVGGGPIPIGKTLHMEPSGCRSSTYKPCHQPQEEEDDDDDSSADRRSSNSSPNVGSAGLAIDFQSSEEYSSEGLLVVSELGEGRIVRMEESGARTPLVIQVPSFCADATTTTHNNNNNNNDNTPLNRLQNPTALLYTPFGDLLIGESNTHCDDTSNNHNPNHNNDTTTTTTTTTTTMGGIIRVKNAMSIQELPSIQSRQAHSWNSTFHHHQQDMEILYLGKGRVIGLALDPSWTGVFVTSIQQPQNNNDPSSVSIHHVTFDMDDTEDDDEDDDDDKEVKTTKEHESPTENSKPRGLLDDSAKLVYTAKTNTTNGGGAIAVDRQGHIYLATTNGILVLDGPHGNLLTTLHVPKTPTSLTLGEDGFLYVSTVNQLFRIRVKHGPVLVPINLVGKKQTSFAHALNH